MNLICKKIKETWMKFDKNSPSVNLARHKAQLVVHYSERDQFSKILTTKDSNYNKELLLVHFFVISKATSKKKFVCV